MLIKIVRAALVMAAALSVFASSAQAPSVPSEPRIALIIANYKYAASKDRLAGPVQDAAVLSKSLRDRGFVGVDANSNAPTVEFNLTKAEIEERVLAFKRRLEAAGPLAIGLVYYAGHGGSNSAGTDNFLIPVDVPDVATADVAKVGVAARFIRGRLESIDSHPKIMIVLDACRTIGDDAGSRGANAAPNASGAGLRMAAPDLQQPRGILMALSTGAHQTASDSGLYAETLAEKIGTAGLNLAGIFEETKLQVARKTGNKQIPIYHSQITDAVCLAGCTVAPTADPMVTLKLSMDVRSAGDTGQVTALEQLTRNGKSLSGLDLRAIYFSRAQVPGVDLSRAELGLADFDEANLTNAKLAGAFFIFSGLKGAKLMGAEATEARFYFTNGEGADFSRINAERSNWQAALLRGANFRNANLQNANFLNADLRDADFTGADLRGAFFIAAAIKGARFDQAQIANTDFSGAMGAASQFNAAQQARLCGTDSYRNHYNYVIRTFDKSAPIGDRYHTLFEGNTSMPSGVRYLAECTPRSVMAAGNKPVWLARDHEAMTERLTLEFPPDMVDAAGRRARLQTTAETLWGTLKSEGAAGSVVTVTGKRSQELLETIRANANGDPKITNEEPRFDYEAAFLYQVRYQPQSIPKEEWDRRARGWVERDNRRAQATAPDINYWPALFPPGTLSNELTEAHVEQFRKWTIARAKVFPSRVALDFPSQNVEGTLANMQDEQFDSTHTPFLVLSPLVTYAAEHAVQSATFKAQVGADATNMFERGICVVHSKSPLASITVKIPRSMSKAVRAERPTVQGAMEVTGARIVPTPDRQFLVLDANVKDVQIRMKDGLVIKGER